MIGKIRKWWKVFRYFSFPGIRNFDDLWNCIIWVNRGMHTFYFDKDILATVRDDLTIHIILRKYWERARVGYFGWWNC